MKMYQGKTKRTGALPGSSRDSEREKCGCGFLRAWYKFVTIKQADTQDPKEIVWTKGCSKFPGMSIVENYSNLKI